MDLRVNRTMICWKTHTSIYGHVGGDNDDLKQLFMATWPWREFFKKRTANVARMSY